MAVMNSSMRSERNLMNKNQPWKKRIIYLLGIGIMIITGKMVFQYDNVFSEMVLSSGMKYSKVECLEGNMAEYFFPAPDGERVCVYKEEDLAKDEKISISEYGDSLSIEALYKDICFSYSYTEWLKEQGMQLYINLGNGRYDDAILEPVAVENGISEGYRIEKYMQEYGMTWSDIRHKQEYFLFGKVVNDWSNYTGSRFKSGNIGDVEIINHLDYGEAVISTAENADTGIFLKDVSVWNRPRVLDEDAEEIKEIENKYYSIRCLSYSSEDLCEKKESESITEFTRQYSGFCPTDEHIGNSVFYDTYWINIFLDYFPYGCKLYSGDEGQKKADRLKASYEILYADDQYLCVRNYGTVTYGNIDKYYENVTLLDLYKTGIGNGALSVGEGEQYDFKIDLALIGEKIENGDYWLDNRGINLFNEDDMQIRQAIWDFFEEKQYIYRTYIREGRIGFLIPFDKSDEPYLKLEVSYDWKLPEEKNVLEEALCKQIYADQKEWKDEVRKQDSDSEVLEESDSILCYLYNDSLLCVKNQLIYGNGYAQEYYYRYVTYDVNTGQAIRLGDIVNIDDEFIQWLKESEKAEGNLAKAVYSQEEGRVMTLRMLKNCPKEKLKEALEECEFYLEPERLYIKLPYWNNKLLNKGWICNGEGKTWNNWLVIRLEDIEDFLRSEWKSAVVYQENVSTMVKNNVNTVVENEENIMSETQIVADYLEMNSEEFLSKYNKNELYEKGVLYCGIESWKYQGTQLDAYQEDYYNVTDITAIRIRGKQESDDVAIEKDLDTKNPGFVCIKYLGDYAISVYLQESMNSENNNDNELNLVEFSFIKVELEEGTAPEILYSYLENDYYQVKEELQEALWIESPDGTKEAYISNGSLSKHPSQIFIRYKEEAPDSIFRREWQCEIVGWIDGEHLVCNEVDMGPILIHLENNQVEQIKKDDDDFDPYGAKYIIDGNYLICQVMDEEIYRWNIVRNEDEIEWVDILTEEKQELWE